MRTDYRKYYDNCILCPRNCRVNRNTGDVGYCGQRRALCIARSALHYWEEPSISGTEGSGAVFFSGCNLRCVFCQNYRISSQGMGYEISIEELAEEFLKLQGMGALNINLVTASIHVPSVIRAIDIAKNQGLMLPILYNSSGYESVDTLRMLEGYIDIYLPDYKYFDGELARSLSGVPDYPEVARAAIAEMYRQTGPNIFADSNNQAGINELSEMNNPTGPNAFAGDTGIESPRMIRGTIVRHLVLPGHVKNARAVLYDLFKTYGNQIYISIMSQYTPLTSYEQDRLQNLGLNRRITKREYDKVVDYALELGIENAYIQDREVAKESFIPQFRGDRQVEKMY